MTAVAPVLRLKATDSEDLAILSACLQDALVAVADMSYLVAERRFILVVNRFVWEEACGGTGPKGPFRRVLSALCFDDVDGVARHGLDPRSIDAIVSLLAIRCQMHERGSATIELVFAGDAALRLEVRGILCHLKDVGDDWPTAWRPSHEPL